ncbi:MAG: WYL domain-containing protein [Firmicutes bacterium]|nr:WYL domain-containing protein [Bacillota bacterium]
MREDGKERAVRVLLYLYENTDETHFATIKMISEHLAAAGIQADRRTIADDIENIKRAGVGIECERSTQNRYRVAARSLSVTEIKLLIDAVQSSRFIGREDSRLLIEKLASSACAGERARLRGRLYYSERPKARSRQLFHTTDIIWRAVYEKRMICFKYFTYDSKKRRVYKHGGRVYMLSVYSVLWNNDNYYVVGYDELHGGTTTFRADRMDGVMLTATPARGVPATFSERKYAKSVFDMYDGREYDAEFLCRSEAMDAVIDKFGEGAETRPHGSDKFVLSAKVAASPTFYAWLFMFSDRITIISPRSLCAEYAAYLRRAADALYETKKKRQRNGEA